MNVIMGIIRPRIEEGCDWGIEREVLVRLQSKRGAEKELWYTRGFKFWSGNYQPWEYARSCVSFAVPYSFASSYAVVGGANTSKTELFEGRFSLKKIREHAKEIDEFFGEEVSGLIHRGRTVLIER